MTELTDRVASSEPLSDDEVRALAELPEHALGPLLAAARKRRDSAWGSRITFSPKVFLPITNLCRNRCDYCSFRKSPGDEGEWTMAPDEVVEWLERARSQGCAEALLCLGDKPESGFSSYREQLEQWGHESTVDYLERAAELALERGLLPHTNAGVLSKQDMQRLRRANASLGLMLENVSPRLCEKGMPHHKAPDKRPHLRLQMLEEAGELRIPFTTGLLIGIGETARERADTLLAIRDAHARHGHVQEVIVQNFRTRPEVPMAHAPEPEDRAVAHCVALARVALPADVSVQAPPNLNAHRTRLLLDAGINDFGGISPVSPDYINPRHPWPQLEGLSSACAAAGFVLKPRPPVYRRYLDELGWLDEALTEPVRAQFRRLDRVRRPSDLAQRERGASAAVAARVGGGL